MPFDIPWPPGYTGVLPDGTAASFLPLAGGTLTGPLIGTSATLANLVITGSITGAGSFLPVGGGTLTGPLIGTSASFSTTLGVTGLATLTGGATIGSNTFNGVAAQLNGVSGGVRWVRWSTAGSNRWQIGPSPGAESGSNAGADLLLAPFDDTGTNLNRGLTLTRASGGLSQVFNKALASNTLNDAPNSGLLLSQTFSGTSATAQMTKLNSIVIGDSVASSGGGMADDFQVLVNYGGTRGSRQAFDAVLNQTSATADLANGFFVAFNGTTQAAFNNGGTGTTLATSTGHAFGGNLTSHLLSGATNYRQSGSLELNNQIGVGASAAIRSFLSIALLGTGVPGAVVDAGMWVYSDGTAAGLKTGILFGSGGVNQYPMDAAGTYIADDALNGAAACAYGIHFVGSFATASIAVPGFIVDGGGTASFSAGATMVGASSLTVGSTTGGAVTTIPGTGSVAGQVNFGNGGGVVAVPAAKTLTLQGGAQVVSTMPVNVTPGTQAVAAAVNPAFNVASGVSGTAIGSPAFRYHVNSLVISPDTLALPSVNQFLNGVAVQHNFGGSGMTGNRQAMQIDLIQTAATSNTIGSGTLGFYVGAAIGSTVSFNDGGSGLTSATAHGRAFGLNPSAVLKAGATNYFQVTAAEFNAQVDAGASTAVRNFISIAALNSAGQGAVVDAGIWYYSASGGGLLKTGLLFGGGGLNNFPIDPAGTYIADDTSGSVTATASYGIHFVGAFTTASIAVPGLIAGATSLGFYGHAAVAQPAAPVTLADCVAIIRGCGLSA